MSKSELGVGWHGRLRHLSEAVFDNLELTPQRATVLTIIEMIVDFGPLSRFECVIDVIAYVRSDLGTGPLCDGQC